jgi:hypothetical protein
MAEGSIEQRIQCDGIDCKHIVTVTRSKRTKQNVNETFGATLLTSGLSPSAIASSASVAS